MAQYKVKGPDGGDYQFEAASDAEAAAAVDELFATQGGQGQPQAPQAPQQSQDPAFQNVDTAGQFDAAFNQGAPQNMDAFRPKMEAARPAMMEAADQQINGEADNAGRFWEFTNSLNLGFGDELSGALAGGLEWAQGGSFDAGYEQKVNAIRQTRQGYRDRHPVESAAIGFAGALPSAMIPGAAAVRGTSLAGKMARGAAAGAGYGAVSGYGEGEGGVANRAESAAVGAAVGGGIGAAVPAVGAGIGRAVGRRAGQAAVPTVEQLDDAAKALYQRVDSAGIAIQPRAVQRLTSVLPQRLSNLGFDPVLHPKSARVVQVLEERVAAAMQPTNGAHTVLSLGEVENMRRVIRQAISASSGPDSKADRQMANRILDQFDTWMTGLQPKDMLAAGPNGISGREGIQIIQEARSLWTKKSKGDVLADLVERAQLDDDFEKGLRREFRTLSRNKERMRQFTNGEKEQIRNVATGGPMGWLMRAVGSLAPGASPAGVVKGTIGSGAGFAVGGPAGAAAVPAVAYGAKKLGDAATRRALTKADTMVRAGGSVPIADKAAREAGDYATRLIGAGAQAGIPRPGIEVMFPNDSPTYR